MPWHFEHRLGVYFRSRRPNQIRRIRSVQAIVARTVLDGDASGHEKGYRVPWHHLFKPVALVRHLFHRINKTSRPASRPPTGSLLDGSRRAELAGIRRRIVSGSAHHLLACIVTYATALHHHDAAIRHVHRRRLVREIETQSGESHEGRHLVGDSYATASSRLSTTVHDVPPSNP